MHDTVTPAVLPSRMATTRVTAWTVEINVDAEIVIAAIDGDALVEILVCSRRAAENLLVQLDEALARDE